MAIEISVAEYAGTPQYHKKNKPVPKPTVFKQIRENRLPDGVSARLVGGRYIMTVLGDDEVFALVGLNPKDRAEEIILLVGNQRYLADLAKKINALGKYTPVNVRPVHR